jgi:hypothetical protein
MQDGNETTRSTPTRRRRSAVASTATKARSSKRRTLIPGRVLLALAAATAVITIGAPRAEALPNNCSVHITAVGEGAWANCSGGTGRYRLRITCDAWWPSSDYYRYGQWMNAGDDNVICRAFCSNYDLVIAIAVFTLEY